MTQKKKSKTVIAPDEKALALMPDNERRLIEAMQEKVESVQSVSFKDSIPIPPKDKPEALVFAVLMEICKATDISGALQLVNNAAAGWQYWENTDTGLKITVAQIAELDPQTPLEAMLVSQMVAVNSAVGQIMRRAMLKDQIGASREMNINLATKLQRTFLQQIEALQKLKGKGQQTVRVEHVTVNSGGQAIVGNVEHKTGGRGQR